MDKILNYFNDILISLDIVTIPKNVTPYNNNSQASTSTKTPDYDY